MKKDAIEVPVKEIKSNEKNPRFIRDHKFEKLVKSIKEFPEMLKLRPIVVNSDMVVLGGNMRLKACIEAKIKKVPVIVAEGLTPEQEQEFIIKDNSSFGEWDWDILVGWDNEKLQDWGLELPNTDYFDTDDKEDEDAVA